MSLNISALREQFPILKTQIDGKPLVYLDNAATTQKPQVVIDALVEYYSTYNANVHRGSHYLSDEATRRYENARTSVANFINAAVKEEVIWTSGTTESLNIIAHGLMQQLGTGDQVVITEMEHHANLVTWQQACIKAGAKLVVIPINEAGELDLRAYESALNSATKLVAFPHVSNALGTINPIEELTLMAKNVGALVSIDGAQGIAHGGVDVQAIGCDFYSFSGHKLFGPTGIGCLWGRKAVLEDWPVWQTGGEMIADVEYQSTTFGALPNRLEAGTPNISGAIGMAAAIDWFADLDQQAVQTHEKALLARAIELAADMPGMRLIGTATNKVGIMSFLLEGTHPADIGFILDRQGIAIRTGDNCAQPLMKRLKIPGTARASFSIYNTIEEVEAFFIALKKAQTMLA
ncbi:aminotransferase class V-fold PLP-dependent enzyme [Alteromonas sp. ASW11-130]|uniref:aminotransferase class V-fold PLP-dependent enzyme n=1 Tax=Alteromonas sp. ASW11-130 TaxID=3015775 RepID=UPI0022423774|nr:cysteine desulfurase [Alteromonas sp. ASW11-130]MCW8091341.1 cysteine desulfurase [Alteromonas sp. ASW11-130]